MRNLLLFLKLGSLSYVSLLRTVGMLLISLFVKTNVESHLAYYTSVHQQQLTHQIYLAMDRALWTQLKRRARGRERC